MSTKDKPNELRIVRMYDAPVNQVWDAWTDPKKISQWWGPRGFTLTHHHKDKELKTGGTWHYTMHGPDGVDYPNQTQYLEVEKHSRLVYDHGANDERPPMFRVTVLFTQANGKTKMEMTMAFPTSNAAEDAQVFIKKAGGNATWDRLAEYLSKESSGKEQFVINRTFNTPIKTMFEMWTDQAQFAQWMGPAGSSMKFFRSDIKPGGSTFYMMSGANGFKLYGKTYYLEIEAPNRIVYTQQFCDENEKVTRHPMAPIWPETMLTVVTFAEEGNDKTRVTVTWEAHGSVTHEEITAFVEARGGMTQGWTGSFDKLEDFLSARNK